MVRIIHLETEMLTAIDAARTDESRKAFVMRAIVKELATYGVEIKPVMRPCKQCGKLFIVANSRRLYCSKNCRVAIWRKHHLDYWRQRHIRMKVAAE